MYVSCLIRKIFWIVHLLQFLTSLLSSMACKYPETPFLTLLFFWRKVVKLQSPWLKFPCPRAEDQEASAVFLEDATCMILSTGSNVLDWLENHTHLLFPSSPGRFCSGSQLPGQICGGRIDLSLGKYWLPTEGRQHKGFAQQAKQRIFSFFLWTERFSWPHMFHLWALWILQKYIGRLLKLTFWVSKKRITTQNQFNITSI